MRLGPKQNNLRIEHQTRRRRVATFSVYAYTYTKKNRISIAIVISWLSIRSFVESNRY